MIDFLKIFSFYCLSQVSWKVFLVKLREWPWDPIVHLKIVPFFKHSIRKRDIVTRGHKANMSTFMNFLI